MQLRRIASFILVLFLFFISNKASATVIEAQTSGPWSTGSTWLGGTAPGPTDSVLIDGFIVDATNLVTSVKSIRLTNDSGSEGGLNLYGSTVLTVDNGFYVQGEGRNVDLGIYLHNSAQLIVNGLFKMERLSSNSDNKKVALYAYNSSKIYANSGFIYDYHDSGTGENNIEILLSNNSLFEITGNGEFYNRNGRRLSVEVYWYADLRLNDQLKAELSNGDSLSILVSGITGKLTVADTTTLTNNGGAGVLQVNTTFAGSIGFGSTVNMVSTGAANKVYLNGDAPTISDIKIEGDLNLDTWTDGSVEVSLNSYSQLQLAGDVNRINGFGSLAMSNTSKLILNGDTPQIIPGAAGAGLDSLKITNLSVSNTSGIILGGPLFLTKNLQLDTGIIVTTSTNLLTLADGVTVSGGSEIAYIDGPMTKIGSTGGQKFTYPIGKNGIYAPLTIDEVTNSSFEYTAEYFRQAPTPGALGTGLNNISSIEFWSLDASSGSDAVGVTLGWSDATNSGISEIDDLVMTRFNDGTNTWFNIGNGGTTGGDQPGESGTIIHDLSCPPPCCHSIITIGSTTASNSLPLDLISFTAKKIGDWVNLNWVTSNEINVGKINVECSSDGIHFKTIDQVNPRGGIGITTYHSADKSPASGSNFYRLQIADFQDRNEYSEIIQVNFEQKEELTIFPNPAINQIQIDGFKGNDEPTQVEVFNQSGQLIYSGMQKIGSSSSGISTDEINVKLPGLYFLYVTNAGKTSIVNFIKE